MFSSWLFDEMERIGVVKNYDKTPHTGKGRQPAGNLSINIARINELKQDSDFNNRVWGIVAYVAFISNGVAGKKTMNELAELSKTETKLQSAVIRSADLLHKAFEAKYKKNS